MKTLFTKTRLTVIASVIALQVLALSGEYLYSVYPLVTGNQIVLNMAPADPRSIFMGNYARLNYSINRLPTSLLDGSEPRHGEIIYVTLKENKGVWDATSASLSKPKHGAFIRGRVDKSGWRWRWGPDRSGTMEVRYGIEAYYAPKEEALALEQRLWRISPDGSQTVKAKVMVAPNGKAALLEVVG